MTLNAPCAAATRRASAFCPTAASAAVAAVPTFAPRITQQERLIGERLQQIGEERARRERRGPVADELHPEEQEPEAEDRLPDVPEGAAPGHVQEPADEDDERRHLEELEGEELNGHRGTDVGPEDHADRLPEREQARRGEADEHHRGRARGLQDRGHARPDEERPEPVAGQGRQDVPQPRPGRALQSLADEMDAVEEECRAAEQREEDEVALAHRPPRLTRDGESRPPRRAAAEDDDADVALGRGCGEADARAPREVGDR